MRQSSDVGGDDAVRDAPVRVHDLHLLLKLAALAAVAVVAAGWLGYVALVRDAGARPLAYRDVTRELRAQPTLTFVRRFSRSEQLADFVRRSGDRPTPRIDFARNEALLVSAGPRSSTGYELLVAGAREEHGRLFFTVREHTPTRAHPGHARVTYPYRLLVFRRTDKPLYVHWVGRP
jgi:hypothetical protein